MQADTESRLQELCEAEKLIVSSNTAGFLDDETVGRLHQAAAIPCLASDGTVHPLLNEDELEAISVRRGTLTADERRMIESHVVLTDKLLSKVEFRGIYKPVRKWATGHHELLDGSGYPAHLQSDAIPWETRLLTILDIYDALTAEDRISRRSSRKRLLRFCVIWHQTAKLMLKYWRAFIQAVHGSMRNDTLCRQQKKNAEIRQRIGLEHNAALCYNSSINKRETTICS